MSLSQQEGAVLEQVGLEEAWPLIEHFSTRPREHPTDVNASMAHLVSRLQAHGIPVTVHRPSLYLSLPGKAHVECGGQTFRAKPPAFSISKPSGFSAPLAYVPAKRTDGIDNIFDMKLQKGQDYSALAAKIVVTEGFASPGHVSQLEAVGAAGLIAINPGEDIHWGICTTIWGTPGLDELPDKPGIPAVRRQPDGRSSTDRARRNRERRRRSSRELEEGWYRIRSFPWSRSRAPSSRKNSSFCTAISTAGTSASATTRSATLRCSRSPGSCGRTGNRCARSVRIAWWPGHSTGRYAGSTWFADAFAIDLDRNCVAQINCDSARMPIGDRGSSIWNRMPEARGLEQRDRWGHCPQGRRSTWRATEPGWRLLVQQYRAYRAISCCRRLCRAR